MIMRRGLWLVLAALVVIGLVRLKFDAEVLNLLPRELPEVKGLVAYQDLFDGSNDLLITLKAEDSDIAKTHAGSLAKFLGGRENLTGGVRWQPPWEEHPEQASELTAAMWFNQPPAQMRELVERFEPGPLAEHLEALRAQLAISFSPEELARLSYDPLGLLDVPNAGDHGFMEIADDGAPFSSAMGDFRVLFVESPYTLSNYTDAMAWLASIETSIADWKKTIASDELPVIKLTGGPTFHSEISQGMERDMKRSIIGTAFVVSALFFFVHRRIKPLMWLLAMLSVILAATMAVGGLVLGNLNVVSLGFAAILLGLAVDYGLVLYQERQAHPELDYRSARQLVAPGILWSAFTTAIAFGLLNFGGLPGLAQLGTLVAVGVLIAAGVMLVFFLKPLENSRLANQPSGSGSGAEQSSGAGAYTKMAGVLTLVLLVGAIALLVLKPPTIDATSKPLRPARSLAYDAMDEFEDQVSNDNYGWSLLVNGGSEQAVADELKRLRVDLGRLREQGMIGASALPDAFWANPLHQQSNREAAHELIGKKEAVFQQVRDAGFTDDSLNLADTIFDGWKTAVSSKTIYWPSNVVSEWVLGQSTARSAERFIAVGRVQPESRDYGRPWEHVIQNENVWIAGWDRLGPALMNKVETRLQVVSALICFAVLAVLMMTFRSLREVMLSLGVLGFSGLMLLATMSILGWEWNLMNLMAVPLLLGGTVDYTIHTQLSLRRNHGNAQKVFRSTGKALLLCAATTAVGFGSLGFSNNAGLASLGKVCSVGAVCSALVACYLLPSWWELSLSRTNGSEVPPKKPSKFYGATCWKIGSLTVGFLPLQLSRSIAVVFATMYSVFARRRFEVVLDNLLPVLDCNQSNARSASRKLFRNFAIKIVDLLHFENGGSVQESFREANDKIPFLSECGKSNGTLLLAVHLGNWEYGAPLLKKHGVDLLVLTMAEPGEGFTELRQAARARWGIETIVIGQDAFAFVEVLKRLREGAVIALLVDRPADSGSVEVELFERPFKASIAAAELARASGCSLIPVIIPLGRNGYEALSLPSINYDRSMLDTREKRREMTQQIMRAFEPWIRQYPDQWFHFVPIWPESSASQVSHFPD